jgi:hypothetical protein
MLQVTLVAQLVTEEPTRLQLTAEDKRVRLNMSAFLACGWCLINLSPQVPRRGGADEKPVSTHLPLHLPMCTHFEVTFVVTACMHLALQSPSLPHRPQQRHCGAHVHVQHIAVASVWEPRPSTQHTTDAASCRAPAAVITQTALCKDAPEQPYPCTDVAPCNQFTTA